MPIVALLRKKRTRSRPNTATPSPVDDAIDNVGSLDTEDIEDGHSPCLDLDNSNVNIVTRPLVISKTMRVLVVTRSYSPRSVLNVPHIMLSPISTSL